MSVLDRGLAYGDGVFRTLSVKQGNPLNWQRQYQKLKHDCEALQIACPSTDILLGEIQSLCKQQQDCVAKIIITRGVGQRGYAPTAGQPATRILSASPAAQYDPEFYSSGITVHVCHLKLGHQPLLAGIKHLNRLENVLAAKECAEAETIEGLLEDEDGFVISGTRSNLFWVNKSTLYTSNLEQCGVAGVQRDRVIDWAIEQDMPYKIVSIQMHELLVADEIFLVNSVFGLWPVRRLLGYNRTIHPVSWQIQKCLNDENH